MPKKSAQKKRPTGRPPIKGIRRCVTLTADDDELFINLGRGCRSLGIRHAAKIIRDHKLDQ